MIKRHKEQNAISFTYSKMAQGDYRDTWKVFRIMAEFVDGYQFLSQFKSSITIFGSARTKEKSRYYQDARDLAKLLAGLKYEIITGGGPGIMEAANRGATEAGGESIGLNIQLPFEQRINDYVKKSTAFYYFFTRKVMLTAPSLAFVAYPGGFGTLDEIFEVLDMMEMGYMDKVPFVLVGKEYWEPLFEFLEENAFEKIHSIQSRDLSLVTIVDDADEAFAIISKKAARVLSCSLSPQNFHCDTAINWRIFRIMAEVVEGFEFLTGITEDVTILGTKSIPSSSSYYKAAEKLGKKLAEKKFSVMTGGGSGVMEAANKGAFEADGDSIGIYTKTEDQGRVNPFMNRSLAFSFPFIRKLILTSPSKAFVLFPGGLGTMHQCFEILILLQTQKMPPVPVILFGKDYWQPLLKFLKNNVFERHHAITKHDTSLYHVVDTVEQAMNIILKDRKKRKNGSNKNSK